MNAAELAAGLVPTPSYRYADTVGNRLLLAGQVPIDEQGNLIGVDDPKRQAGVCLDNLRTLVEVHGFALADVHQLTIYVVGEHQRLLDAWEGITEWFANDVPPATLLGVNLLGYGDQLVEIDATVERER